MQSGLQADPDNVELVNLKTELEEVITLTETAIAELKPTSATANAKKVAAAPTSPPREKWSKENHPAYQAGYRKTEAPRSPVEEPQAPTTISVNDSVMAKWKSGDRAFYPARITSITGSSSKPVYIVTFKQYSTTETLSAHEIKHLSNDSKKRKADGTPAASSTPNAPTNSGVISAAANIDPTLASQAKREPSKVSDGPTRPAKVPRKVKANKELEAGKSKWQDFTTKGKLGKVAKKDSMFRTPDGVNARGKISSGFSKNFVSVKTDETFLQLASPAQVRGCAKMQVEVATSISKTETKSEDIRGLSCNLFMEKREFRCTQACLESRTQRQC